MLDNIPSSEDANAFGTTSTRPSMTRAALPTAGSSLAGRKVGFVGAGQMGSAMVSRLVQAGATVRVHARRPEARRELAAAGAEVVDSVAEVGPGNEVVVSCLYSDAQLREILPELRNALERDSLFVTHTTGLPETTRLLGPALAADGIGLVEAPFSGRRVAAMNGDLFVMLAADRSSDLDMAEPFLRTYAGALVRTGGYGTALMLKLVNNLIYAANVQLAIELARVTEQLHIPLAEALAVLDQSSGGTRALGYLGEFGSVTAFRDRVSPFLGKDVALCESAADGLGIDLGLLLEVARGPNLTFQSDAR